MKTTMSDEQTHAAYFAEGTVYMLRLIASIDAVEMIPWNGYIWNHDSCHAASARFGDEPSERCAGRLWLRL
jgi:hypothetical protein